MAVAHGDAFVSARRAAGGGGAARPVWTHLPLALVVVTLIGSVVVPARQSWRIMRLLRETTEAVEPARLMEARLELALTREAAALEGYAFSGDTAMLGQYRAAARDDARQLAALTVIAPRLDAESAADLSLVRARIAEWRRSVRAISEGRLPRAQLDSALRARQGSYDAVLRAVERLSSSLSAASATRRERIRAAERLSLIVNVSLVLVALAALIAVAGLSTRERRLSALLSRRVEEEATLRQAAEALAAEFTADGVLRQIARWALPATGARGAVIEEVSEIRDASGEPSRAAVARAVAGSGVPRTGTEVPFEGSCAALVLSRGEPLKIPDLARPECPCTLRGAAPEGCSALAVPLGRPGVWEGVLFLLHESAAEPHAVALERAQTFAHLATLAYEKVRLLDEAHRARGELERVMSSRSRLMRGFTHDIRNPLVAADGNAALLGDGIFGPLDTAQMESVARVRRCIHAAFTLIDDLHELARTETGHIALALGVVDLAELTTALMEEYRASASARGLAVVLEVAADAPPVVTDRARVRQILANLLSNAIKYTGHGSVALRVRPEPASPEAGSLGWVRIDVADTGHGIPAEKHEAIFEEFTRLDTGDANGAGLGLAISRRLARALGGRITVESEVGRGSTFTLRLPLREPDAGPERAPA